MSSDAMQAFHTYATAFEVGFASRDWKATVGPRMTADVVWSVAGAPPPFGGVWQGHDDVLGAILYSTDHFDRRFDAREPRIVDGPTEIPGGIHLRWVVTYRRAGLPPFELQGEEWDLFRDGKLEFHHERITNPADTLAYLGQHGEKLHQR
ncbi:MAG: hypothetical protein ACREI8_11625 [Myxococcota bacterium]